VRGLALSLVAAWMTACALPPALVYRKVPVTIPVVAGAEEDRLYRWVEEAVDGGDPRPRPCTRRGSCASS